MKIFLLCMSLSSLIFAQSAFSDGKIDTHGGEYDAYSGYRTNSFDSSNMGLSFLKDKNATKTKKEKKKK